MVNFLWLTSSQAACLVKPKRIASTIRRAHPFLLAFLRYPKSRFHASTHDCTGLNLALTQSCASQPGVKDSTCETQNPETRSLLTHPNQSAASPTATLPGWRHPRPAAAWYTRVPLSLPDMLAAETLSVMAWITNGLDTKCFLPQIDLHNRPCLGSQSVGQPPFSCLLRLSINWHASDRGQSWNSPYSVKVGPTIVKTTTA